MVPSTMFGLSDAWRGEGKHWHAYREVDAPPPGSVDRCRQLRRAPDEVLRSPDEVAEWIERQVLELGERRKVRAIADAEWVEIGDADDLAHLFGEHVVIASRGDSIYTDIYHSERRIELLVEAVSGDDCSQH